jgi:hypothetical protein
MMYLSSRWISALGALEVSNAFYRSLYDEYVTFAGAIVISAVSFLLMIQIAEKTVSSANPEDEIVPKAA